MIFVEKMPENYNMFYRVQKRVISEYLLLTFLYILIKILNICVIRLKFNFIKCRILRVKQNNKIHT